MLNMLSDLNQVSERVSLFKQTVKKLFVKIAKKNGLFLQKFPYTDSVISAIVDFKEKSLKYNVLYLTK